MKVRTIKRRQIERRQKPARVRTIWKSPAMRYPELITKLAVVLCRRAGVETLKKPLKS